MKENYGFTNTIISKEDSLMNMINDVFSDYFGGYGKSLNEIITNDDKSAEFIRWVLKDDDYQVNDKDETMFEFAKNRATHSVITFLVGLLFINSFGLLNKIACSYNNNNKNKNALSLWMITALYHDWGYYSKDISNSELDYNDITKYHLLEDNYKESHLSQINGYSNGYPEAMAYNYDEIKEYDRYARNYHKKKINDKEKIDHGILGGIKVFDRLIKRLLKLNDNKVRIENDLIRVKSACITIAQHNIYKSDSKDRDSEYGDKLSKLHYESPFVIKLDTPLLLLLSLVDAFECFKRFGKENNHNKNLNAKTLLQKILISIEYDSIAVDYRELKKHIIDRKEESLLKSYNEYIKVLSSMNRWTGFLVTIVRGDVVKITYRDSNQ